jgi:cyclopropane fatty-acyl-phospholipid synthase-like methyltransferase
MVSFAALGGVVMAQGGAPHFVAVDPSDMLSSRVVGVKITDPADNNVGKIEDIVFDGTRTLKGYIVSVGGFLGMDAKYVVVDPKALNVTYDGGVKQWRASINANKDQLKAAPEFKYDGQWKASKN